MSVVDVTPQVLAGMPLPQAPQDGDKEDRGRVLVVAGSPEVPGAAVLAALASLRVGAGKLRMAATADIVRALALAVLEARVVAVPGDADGPFGDAAASALAAMAERCDAVVVGPGMLNEAPARALALALLEAEAKALYVIDAGALPGLDGAERFAAAARGRVVLTPHAGEMAGMLGLEKAQVLADPLAVAREAAERFGATVVMKGATTHVVAPDGRAWRHEGGVVGLGASGSGDVLSGVIGGLLARGLEPAEAAVWSVHLHASAGEVLSQSIGPLGFLARDLLVELPRVMAAKDTLARSERP